MEIQFRSRWFEKCIRDYLDIGDRAVTSEDVRVIKYLFVSTTNGYELKFGKGVLPEQFEFSDVGDEWFCCCLSDTSKYQNVEEFIDIRDWEDMKEISIKEALLEMGSFRKANARGMEEFEDSVREYWAEDSDFEGLEEDEETCDYGILFPEDFSALTSLEVVRLMSCEEEIHSLEFLRALPQLRILEVGEVRLRTLEGLEKLVGLEKLCVWAN